MASTVLSYVPLVNRLVGQSSSATADFGSIPPVEVHDVEGAPERRPRTLKHLLRANHVNHAVIYHDLEFDNHMPHLLCSAYLLGAEADALYRMYDNESRELETWQDSPEEIVPEDWRTYLGDKRYQRAYIDLFEDALTLRYKFDWRHVVEEYMFKGDEPLVNGLIGGLGHPLIHLSYAYEMNSREIAMESLSLAACEYNFLHKYIDDASYTRPAPFRSASPRELLDRLAADDRFADVVKKPGSANLDSLFAKHEAALLEYWNAWDLGAGADPARQFEASQEAAVALLVATVPTGTHAYNFFIVHLLTTSHAVRVLLPVLPARFRLGLVRQWWLLAVAVYVAELRPRIDPSYIPPAPKHTTWNYVEEKATKSEWATNSHFVKAVRAMREAAYTWGDVHNRYLVSAVRFVDEFEGWTF